MNRPFILGLAGAVVVGVALGLTYFGDSEPGKETAAILKAPERRTDRAVSDRPQSSVLPRRDSGSDNLTIGPGETERAASRKPTFDVVRVNPRGDAVIAGRASPNAAVIVRDGVVEVGKAKADARGEWVVIPKQPLPAGSRELTLSSESQGGTAVQSDQNVVIMVPGQPSSKTPENRITRAPGSLAVLVPREGKAGSVVIQKPSSARPRAVTIAPGGKLAAAPVSIDAVDYDDAGNVTISGNATPKAPLSIYVNNRHAASGISDPHGRWRVVPGGEMAPGIYTLRVDHLGSGGKVIGRAETQFVRAEPARVMPTATVVSVEPGNSLWRIARRVYGAGVQYSIIFDANREQIRNPDLIYPGQVFFVPHVN